MTPAPDPRIWMLTKAERRNPNGYLYRDHPCDVAWTEGNDVRPLVDGATYFRRLREELASVRAGDQVFFVDWRGDPTQQLDGPGTALVVELARASSAGAHVFGLVWRSHLDRFRFSERENRNLADALQVMDAEVLLDQRVRRGGSHHQKFVVVRRPEQPERDVAFVGGIDLGRSRRDDRGHGGDPQAQPMPRAYGATPPWHDAMLEIRGPAVADVESCLRERWDDPTALEHARPWLWVADRLRGLQWRRRALPAPLPPPPAAGPHVVQLLRTYPTLSPSYPFAPDGERTVALGYAKALARAQRLVYVEDQFLWSRTVAQVFADALRRRPQLSLVALVPRFPDSESGWQRSAKDAAQAEALDVLHAAGRDRVHVFDLENDEGTPVYVHAKVCIIDDVWAAVGSANLNRRSWTHDSELAAAVLTDGGGVSFARRLRLQLWTEHLGRADDDHDDLVDPTSGVRALDRAATALDDWHRCRRRGARPPGRLRVHPTPQVDSRLRELLQPLTRAVVDPDGRPMWRRHRERW